MVRGMTRMHFGSHVACAEGLCCGFLSIPLPQLTHTDSNHIIVNSHHMFTLVGRLLG